MDLDTLDTPLQDALLAMEIDEEKYESQKFETVIKCTVCETNFSSKERYKIHLGTKKHKRNERNLFKEVFNRENSQLEVPANCEDSCCYKGVREKYWQRNIRNYESNYTSYIWSVTAYWAASLTVNPTVRDYKISLNDKKWGGFGDAVLEVEFSNFPGRPDITITYAIQFKHIVSNNFKNIDSLSEGSYSFKGVISKLARITAQKTLENTKFVVFTTAAISPVLDLYQPVNVTFCGVCFKLPHDCVCSINDKTDTEIKLDDNENAKEIPVFAKPLSTRRRNIIDTSDDAQSVYHFFSSQNEFVLPKIYFHTSQKRPRHFPAAIDDIFFEVLNERQMHVSRDLIKYLENWSQGKCGGFYKLKKEDVLVKLGHMLLSKFMVTPKVQPMNPHNSYNVWLQAINSAHVTILKDSLPNIYEPINLTIEREFGLPIDITDNTLKFLKAKEGDNINYQVKNPILRNYIFEEASKSDIENGVPMEKVYLTCWKAGIIPMILHVHDLHDQEYVIRVISLLKRFGLTRRYFLETCDSNIKAAIKNFKNLSFFVCLDDVIDNLDPASLDRVKIDVTDAFSLSLKTIRENDKFFPKSISATEFFDMALGKYVFKPFGGSLREGETEELKLILNEDQMEIFRHEVESKRDIRYVLKNECTQRTCLRGLDPKLFV